MKTRIFAIAMMVLMTLSLFVPISASAETSDDNTILAGNYKLNSSLTAIDTITTKDELLAYFDEPYIYYHPLNFSLIYHSADTVTHVLSFDSISAFYIDGIFDIDGYSLEYTNYTAVIGVIDNEPIQMFYENGIDYEGNVFTDLWVPNYDLITSFYVPESQVVEPEVKAWIVENTNYNIVNSPEYNQPEYDTPETVHIISKGTYTFNETLIMASDLSQNFSSFFIGQTIEQALFQGMRMVVTSTSLTYNLDGAMTTVYYAPPLANAGWQDIGYRMITFTIDVNVSEEFYNWFIMNTTNTTPPAPNPSYEFYDNGIIFDGDQYAIYKDTDTLRVDVANNYVVMWKNNDTVYIAACPDRPFRKYSGSSSIMVSDQSKFDYWYIENGSINYLGQTASFTVQEWIAGNNSVLNWNDNTVYKSFDNGIVVFHPTPQDSPTLAEIMKQIQMTGVVKEMVVLFPLLLALLTSWIALRKALTLFQTLLSQA